MKVGVRVYERQWGERVAAAQAGDQRALDELIAGFLPLVYNIVGRALDGHLDVDDVVQETMLRAVHGLDGLRDPASFRAWLVAIAMRQVRDRGRVQQSVLARGGAVPAEDPDIADPGADFVDLTILRLQLDGQRREVAEATRWLEREDRDLLSLWWLEVSGELTRAELAEGLGLTPQHAAVRIQRMKAQLEAARSVIRALHAVPRCYELATLTLEWDGRTDSVWRKRLARHTRGCVECGGVGTDVVPAERLLVGLALVPLPVGFGLYLLSGLLGAAPAAAATATAATAATTGTAHAAFAAHQAGWGAQLAQTVAGLLAKPAVAAVAGATLVAGGAAVVYDQSHHQSQGAGGPVPAVTRSYTASETAAERPPTTAAPSVTSVSPSPSPKGRGYGSVVDAVDTAPDPNLAPGTLPRREEGSLVSSAGAKAVLNSRGGTVTLTGRGYFRIRWQIALDGRTGGMIMPTWTGLDGRLFHVASGGTRRMDDALSGGPATRTGMGNPDIGYAVLPDGAQQMWQNEYYWVDGAVTLHENERGADYNLIVEPSSWDTITEDIEQGPEQGAIRYGIVRDTGDDTCPVPQYVTRAGPADQAEVPQDSSDLG